MKKNISKLNRDKIKKEIINFHYEMLLQYRNKDQVTEYLSFVKIILYEERTEF
jgi:hypothetical protein